MKDTTEFPPAGERLGGCNFKRGITPSAQITPPFSASAHFPPLDAKRQHACARKRCCRVISVSAACKIRFTARLPQVNECRRSLVPSFKLFYRPSTVYLARSPPISLGRHHAPCTRAEPIVFCVNRNGTATGFKCIPISVPPISSPALA